MGKFGHTSARQIEVVQRVAQAVDMRLQGYNLREIASQLGVSYETVRKDVLKYLKSVGEDIETKRALSERRLDRALVKMAPRLEAGEPESVRTLVSVENRRAKLRGLDAPVEVRKAVVNRVVIDFNLHATQPQSDPLPSAAPSPSLLPAPSVPGVSSSNEMDLEDKSRGGASSAENSIVDVGSTLGTNSIMDTTALECKQPKEPRKPIELTELSVPVEQWKESERRVWSEYRPGRTLQEIATAIGVTRERVRQVLDTIERERVVGVAPRPQRFSNAWRGKGDVR